MKNFIEFGTGGVRGIMGTDEGGINQKTVGCIIQGFSDSLNSEFSKDERARGVAIAYDSRHNSLLFAQIAAGILAGNQIPVFLFPALETTPMLSFAIRQLKCMGGVCITASHNPPAYNGVKVYWSDGAQIVPPQDKHIAEFACRALETGHVQTIEFADAVKQGFVKYIDTAAMHTAYFEDLFTSPLLPKTSAKGRSGARRLSIVYTPLHGTGKVLAEQLFNLLGFDRVCVVPEQASPDGDFPTVAKPNPEEPEALQLAIKYATERNADLVFATDPDSDRLAVCVRDPNYARGVYQSQAIGDYVLLNGNQTAALLLTFILASMKQKNLLHSTHKVIKTMVTTGLLDCISHAYGVEILNTPTGFKWIAKLIKHWENEGQAHKFLFGAEESFGYMFPNNVRDKDAIAALAYTSVMAVFLRDQNRTLCDALFDLFGQFGVWQESLMCLEFEHAQQGMETMARIMQFFRQTPPELFGGIPVAQKRDYLEAGFESSLFPKSNVLQFILTDGSTISMRPSGTEPKLKFYFSVCTKHENIEKGLKETQEKIQSFQNEVRTLELRTTVC